MASRSWNRVELIGNLTRDPELRYTPNGTAVCTVGLATNRTYISEGERKEDVDFHRIVFWTKLAELASQLLKKGTRAFISGRLQYRDWETQEGQKRREAEIVAEELIVLTPRNGGEMGEYTEEPVTREETPAKEESSKLKSKSKPEDAPKPDESPKEEVVSEEDLPF